VLGIDYREEGKDGKGRGGESSGREGEGRSGMEREGICHRSEATVIARRLTSCRPYRRDRSLASFKVADADPAKTDLLWCTTKGCPCPPDL